MYAFGVTVSALGLSQKFVLNTIAHMFEQYVANATG